MNYQNIKMTSDGKFIVKSIGIETNIQLIKKILIVKKTCWRDIW